MSNARKQTKIVTIILVIVVIFCLVAGIAVGLLEELSYSQDELNYTLEAIGKIEKMSKKDKRLKAVDIEPEEDEVVYLVNILVNNKDTEEISYLSIDAQDQDGNYVSCTVLDPYAFFDTGSRSVIPAGISRNVPVVVILSKEEVKSIESIDFYRWDSEGDEKKVCTISVDELVAKTK